MDRFMCRAKGIDDGCGYEGRWFYGYYRPWPTNPNRGSISYWKDDGRGAIGWHEATVDPKTVGQCTGVYIGPDRPCSHRGLKERVYLFEGDIVHTGNQGVKDVCLITHAPGHGGFFLRKSHYCGHHWNLVGPEEHPAMERVGNIHDNPELFENVSLSADNKLYESEHERFKQAEESLSTAKNSMAIARSVLIKLAAEVLTKHPSTFAEDYRVPKSTPVGAIREFMEAINNDEHWHKLWARRLRNTADILKKGSNYGRTN